MMRFPLPDPALPWPIPKEALAILEDCAEGRLAFDALCVEGAMLQRAWDCIIYRGHGRARTGGIYLELSDGLWKMPRLASALYIHLACMTNFHKLELEDLPAPRLVTPVNLLPDFEDRRLVEIFFDRYKVSGSIDLSMRALQNQFPQFMAFTRGAQ